MKPCTISVKARELKDAIKAMEYAVLTDARPHYNNGASMKGIYFIARPTQGLDYDFSDEGHGLHLEATNGTCLESRDLHCKVKGKANFIVKHKPLLKALESIKQKPSDAKYVTITFDGKAAVLYLPDASVLPLELITGKWVDTASLLKKKDVDKIIEVNMNDLFPAVEMMRKLTGWSRKLEITAERDTVAIKVKEHDSDIGYFKVRAEAILQTTYKTLDEGDHATFLVNGEQVYQMLKGRKQLKLRSDKVTLTRFSNGMIKIQDSYYSNHATSLTMEMKT